MWHERTILIPRKSKFPLTPMKKAAFHDHTNRVGKARRERETARRKRDAENQSAIERLNSHLKQEEISQL
jgi:hypothetical protein